jgi:hypothetical protein
MATKTTKATTAAAAQAAQQKAVEAAVQQQIRAAERKYWPVALAIVLALMALSGYGGWLLRDIV